MTASSVTARTGGTGTGNLFAAVVLSCLLAVLFLTALVYRAGAWDIVAMTRLLDPLIAGGIVQYHDQDPGFIHGIPDLYLYQYAKDPIDWRLVFFSALVFMGYAGLKAVQFARIARAYNVGGPEGSHARSFLYGFGLDQVLPFKLGAVATATSLARQGASAERAASAVFVSDAFTVFEIIVFGAVGLFLLGWSTWLGQIVWAFLIFGMLYALVRGSGTQTALTLGQRPLRTGFTAIRALANERPGELLTLCVLSILAFLVLDVGVYTLMTAFDSVTVLIKVDSSVLLMALVSGYVARLIPMTPGGIGQFEMGFATALFVGAQDVSVSLTVIAILVSALRVATGLILTMVTGALGVHTNVREVVSVFSEAQQAERA
ncbi:MAG: flippase-like domain-containing protein [Deltaproteobacteria bacterium]|nr:flippase-like domain-containing protein [Deltaproteobacteria bacterium]